MQKIVINFFYVKVLLFYARIKWYYLDISSTIFNPIRGLLKTQENYLKHDNLTSLEHGLVQIAQGHNRAVYLPVRPFVS